MQENPLRIGADLIRARYRPAGNVHLPELADKYLSVSKLVSKTAFEYAESILRGGDESDPYWAFKGNGLGNAALADFPCKEIRFTAPIPLTDGRWRIQGHCDAIHCIDNSVFVVEHKAFGDAKAQKVENAFRQGLLYLAMGWDAMRRQAASEPDGKMHDVGFIPADYVESLIVFRWPATATPAGVIVAIAPDRPPGRVEERPCSARECEQLLHFYQSKAWYIVKAVEANDPSLAAEWDLGPIGVQEFAMTLDEMEETADQEMVDLLAAYRDAKDRSEQADEEVAFLKAKIESKLVEANAKKLIVGGHQVSLVEMPAAPVSFIRKPYRQLRVKELAA